MITILLIIVYALIGLGIGWYNGRIVYRYGVDGILPNSASYAFITMALYGMTWPAVVSAWVVVRLARRIPGNKLAEKIFR